MFFGCANPRFGGTGASGWQFIWWCCANQIVAILIHVDPLRIGVTPVWAGTVVDVTNEEYAIEGGILEVLPIPFRAFPKYTVLFVSPHRRQTRLCLLCPCLGTVHCTAETIVPARKPERPRREAETPAGRRIIKRAAAHLTC